MTAGRFWIDVMYAAVYGYFGLGVVIAIGGWFDVWKMLRRLAAEEQAPKNG